MNSKLTKRSHIFLHILYLIFNLAKYYGGLFTFDPFDNPTEIHSQIIEKEGITKLRFSFRKITPFQNLYSCNDMRSIMQEYMEFCLLPESQLTPYMMGTSRADMLPALYIDLVFTDKSYIYMDVIFVDNPLAYRYVRDKRTNTI